MMGEWIKYSFGLTGEQPDTRNETNQPTTNKKATEKAPDTTLPNEPKSARPRQETMLPMWTPTITTIQGSANNNNNNNNHHNALTPYVAPASSAGVNDKATGTGYDHGPTQHGNGVEPIEVSTAVFVSVRTPQNPKFHESTMQSEWHEADRTTTNRRMNQLIRVCMFLLGALVILSAVYYFQFCADDKPISGYVVLTIAAVLIFLLGVWIFGHPCKRGQQNGTNNWNPSNLPRLQ